MRDDDSFVAAMRCDGKQEHHLIQSRSLTSSRTKRRLLKKTAFLKRERMKRPDVAFVSPAVAAISRRRRRPRPPSPSSDCYSSTLFQPSFRRHHYSTSLTRVQAAPFLLRNVASRAPSPATTAAFLIALLVGYYARKTT